MSTKKKLLKKMAETYFLERNSKIREFFEKELQANIEALKNEKFRTNEELIEKLEELAEFAYPIPEKVVEIVEKISSAKPIALKDKPTEFGLLPGKTWDDVLEQCVSLLRQVRYLETEAVIELLAKFSENENKELSNKALEAIEELCKYDLHVLNNVGVQPQKRFIEAINKWAIKKKIRHIDVIVKGLTALLSPDFGGVEWQDFKTVTFRHGGLNATKSVVSNRETALEIAKNVFLEADDPKVQISLLSVFNSACRDSFYTEELRPVVVANVKDVLSFFNETVLPSNPALEVLSELEDRIAWLENGFKTEKLKELARFWCLLEQNEEYKIYRILVGYERRFRRLEMGWEECQKYRNDHIAQYVESINQKNEEEWINRIINIAKTEENLNDSGKFQYFQQLLIQIGEKKSGLGFLLLEINEPFLERFKAYIILGLDKSEKEKIRLLIQEWINKGENLQIIAFAIRFMEKIDTNMLEALFEKIKSKRGKDKKRKLFAEFLYSLGFTNIENKDLFIKTLRELTKYDLTHWTNWFFGGKEGENIFEHFDENDWEVVIENLLGTSDIQYHDEYVLKYLLRFDPVKFVSFFERRIKKEEKFDGLYYRYSSLPFSLHNLLSELHDYEDEITEEVWKWFDKKYGWKAAIFLKALFPGFSSKMDQKINEIIDSKDKKAWKKYIQPIFQWYRGNSLERIIKRTINSFDKDQEMWDTCMIYLSNPGMVSGTTGEPIMANAYRAKKTRVEKWELDNDKIKEFVEGYKKMLDRDIKREEQRHLEEMEKLKRRP